MLEKIKYRLIKSTRVIVPYACTLANIAASRHVVRRSEKSGCRDYRPVERVTIISYGQNPSGNRVATIGDAHSESEAGRCRR